MSDLTSIVASHVTKDWDVMQYRVTPETSREGAQVILEKLEDIIVVMSKWLKTHTTALRESSLYQAAESVYKTFPLTYPDAQIQGMHMPIEGMESGWTFSPTGHRFRTVTMVKVALRLEETWREYERYYGQDGLDFEEERLPKAGEKAVSKSQSLEGLVSRIDDFFVLGLEEERANERRASELLALGRLQSVYVDMDLCKYRCRDILARSQRSPALDPGFGTPGSSAPAVTHGDSQ